MRLGLTLCYDMTTIITLGVYTVCGLPCSFHASSTHYVRGTEINIQAIVEEHYERYMDQEEEYEREHGNILLDSGSISSNSDSD